ncbi:17-beta-hydroxysteroid dehydrogenase 14 [Chelonia mydas]|uniref:17-beta-hydroxysteroid dehydrogenase 14 n=1 Tax=Chelonia mydas TaxID=8469 RepID=M7BUQ0_CHEMY|nr:17-beta-hydroxysteroid dehydrogenase 14 [Chelonia mydas]
MADGERPRSSLSQASSVLTISSVSLGAAKDSERAWGDFAALENELRMLRETLAQIRQLGHPQAITMDPPGPHRARMSVQEQLERMRRHKEGQRQLEGGRPNPWVPRQGSLRASASRVGKTPPEAQMSANPDPSPEPLDAVTNQHVLCTPTLPRGDPEANHVEAEPCGPANRNAAVSANSVQRGAEGGGGPRLIAVTWQRYGRIDCLVNNAGRHPPEEQIDDVTSQHFRELLEVNLVGYFLTAKFALPYLRETRGNIINISSLVGIIGQSQAVPYVATKLLGRMGTVEECALAVMYLAADGTFCTGIDLLLSGGAELAYGPKSRLGPS